MENNIGEIVTALILLIIRFFEKRKLIKQKDEEKYKALDSNRQYYQGKIEEIKKNKKF
jgi:hypothetical protein